MPVTKDGTAVDHSKHYNEHPSGVECIEIVEHFGFNVGNAIKYLWRADLKNGIEDLEKARWYCEREIQRRKAEAEKGANDIALAHANGAERPVAREFGHNPE